MTSTPASIWRFPALVLLFLTSSGSLGAQSVLCVDYQGKACPVYKVHDGYTYIKEGDKLVSVISPRSALVPAPEFLPVFISVRDLSVHTSNLTMMGTATELNKEFHLTGRFETSYALPDVFLVLELNTEKAGKRIFFQEVGDLGPNRPGEVHVVVPMDEDLGPGKFQLHIFAHGLEVFHSQQPFGFREHALDRMVATRIAGVTEAPPKPFVGPAPKYPSALRKAGTRGEASVRIRITPTGAVLDPVLARATDPAFGEAALAAMRQWRFLPQVKGGRPVETPAVEMPFTFSPPASAKKD